MLNRKSCVTQNAVSNNSYQAGRDINIVERIDMCDFEFYEEDIKETILFFNKNIGSLKDIPFPDNKGIAICRKNTINNLSESYFKLIEEDYLPLFGKIRDFLRNPKNEEYVEMYNNSVAEIKIIVEIQRRKFQAFEEMFKVLYNYLIKACKEDKNFMRIRTKAYLFLHFMYYNCDIGIKEES